MRIEFSSRTKLVVAQRCAYRCCFPGCERPTVSPDARSERSTVTGQAAHIFSAAPGGPRGQGGLSEEELRSAQNAIWLCSDHAAFVDKYRGEGFSPEVLLSYKDLREAQVAREQCGLGPTIGWFHELCIRSSPVFMQDSKIRLGKVTIIVGNNGSGKTAVTEWLASLADPSALGRWSCPHGDHLVLEVSYFDPVAQRLRIEVPGRGLVRYFLRDEEVPFLPFKLGLVRLPHYSLDGIGRSDENELALIGDVLQMHTSTVRNLVPHVNRRNEGWIRDLEIHDMGRSSRVCALHEGEMSPLSVTEMSDAQRAKLLVELCVAAARFSSRNVPTILMIDGGTAVFDSANFGRYVDYLMSAEHHFQTVIMRVREPPRRHTAWSGWEFVRLSGSVADVSVDQSPFWEPAAPDHAKDS